MDQEQDTHSTIATCYLRKAGNEQHKAWLSQEHLQLLYNGQLKVFPFEDVRHMSFNHRKLMLPLVVGGTTATLSLVAIIKLYYDPWSMLFLLTAGCLLAYYGYKGSWVLTVEEENTHTDFFLKNISPNLRAFVRYANTFTGRRQKGILYLPLTQKQLEQAQEKGFIRIENTQRLFFGQEVSPAPAEKPAIVPVNTLEENIYLSWKTDKESQELTPYIEAGSLVRLPSAPFI